MPFMQWIPFLSYAFAITASPGPNTLISLSSGNKFGLKKTFILFAGMYSGFYIVMFLCALFMTYLQKLLPSTIPYLKWLGVFFLLYLSYVIWGKGNLSEDNSSYENGYGFKRGFLLQFMNIKIYLYGMTALQTYLLPNFNIPLSCLILTLVGFISAIIWALAGKSLALLFSTHGVLINRILAILLAVIAVTMIFIK